MASKIKVDQIEGAGGSTITIPTGQTFTITDGITGTGANLNKDNQPVSEQNKEEDTNTQQIIETGDNPFIPPIPQTESTINTGDQSRKTTPDAFAEAAIQNGSAQSDKKRGRSLFQKVTGAVNSLVTEEQRASSTSNSALNENIKATESEKSSKTTFSAEESIDTVSNPSSDSFSSEDTIDKDLTTAAIIGSRHFVVKG